MQANDALQYLSQVATDYVRTLPPAAQAPTAQAVNESLAALAQLVNPPPPATPDPAG